MHQQGSWGLGREKSESWERESRLGRERDRRRGEREEGEGERLTFQEVVGHGTWHVKGRVICP